MRLVVGSMQATVLPCGNIVLSKSHTPSEAITIERADVIDAVHVLAAAFFSSDLARPPSAWAEESRFAYAAEMNRAAGVVIEALSRARNLRQDAYSGVMLRSEQPPLTAPSGLASGAALAEAPAPRPSRSGALTALDESLKRRQQRLEKLGPRPGWWRPFARRRWDRELYAISQLSVSELDLMLMWLYPNRQQLKPPVDFAKLTKSNPSNGAT